MAIEAVSHLSTDAVTDPVSKIDRLRMMDTKIRMNDLIIAYLRGVVEVFYTIQDFCSPQIAQMTADFFCSELFDI